MLIEKRIILLHKLRIGKQSRQYKAEFRLAVRFGIMLLDRVLSRACLCTVGAGGQVIVQQFLFALRQFGKCHRGKDLLRKLTLFPLKASYIELFRLLMDIYPIKRIALIS